MFYSPVCRSTQNLALICAAQTDCNPPFVLYTYDQRKGRGQGGNTWNSQPGNNIALSLVSPVPHPDESVLLNKAIALAARSAIEEISGLEVFIKWPNDLIVRNRKVGGLLMEVSQIAEGKRWLCTGLGINVNQTRWEDLPNASSLKRFTGNDYALLDVLKIVVRHFQQKLDTFGWEQKTRIEQEFLNALWKLNKEVTALLPNGSEFMAILRGVDQFGRVILEAPDGSESTWHHGQIRLILKNIF